jgi:hypothetical protein
MSVEDIYNVNKYTDPELYSILDLVNPTDRELEAKIFHMISKYKNMQNDSGNKLADFFNDIYARFFEIEEIAEVENKETENMALENPDIMYLGNNIPQIVATQNYIPGYINPLLNQVITRVISIDSQYRDAKKTSLATNFTFNLSETLNNVLAIRLNSIQIPKTWYTISKSYGANFFYLKGNVPGINDGLHDYQIKIPVGNYTSKEVIDTLNKSISNISATYTDACFGTTGFSYNTNTCKATLTVDYNKIYNEPSFAISFPTFSYSIDASNTNKYTTIPQLLGFDTSFIPINYITSNIFDASNQSDSKKFNLNDSNNFFTILNYNGYDSSNQRYIQADESYSYIINDSSSVYNTIFVKWALPNGEYTRSDIVATFNKQLQQNTNLTGASMQKITITDASMTGYNVYPSHNYYKFVVPLNPLTTTNAVNMKTAVVFPNDSTLWIGSQSCFQFDQSINEISTFKSNTNAKISDYNVGSNVYFTLKCDASGYADSAYNNLASNNIRCNVQQNKIGTLYGLNDYISQINTSISAANASNNYFFSFDRNINVSGFVLNSTTNNYLRMRFYIQKQFTTPMYSFDSSSDCLFSKILDFKYQNHSLAATNNTTNLLATLQQAFTYYTIPSGVLFRLYPNKLLNLGNQNADPFVVYLDCSNVFHNHYDSSLSTYASGSNFYYDTANKQFVNAQVDDVAEIFNWAIQNWKDPILNDYPLSNSSITITRDPSNNEIASYYNLNSRFDMNINVLLNVKNYRIIFTDDANNSWNKYLFLDNSYNLQDWSYNRYLDSSYSYAIYMPENKKIYGNLITLNKDNNYFYIEPNASGVTDPTNANRIKIEIDASTNGTNYTLNTMINQINAAFDLYAKGSRISTDAANNVYIRINHSKIYNTENYRLVFYDPFSFVRCYIGATSVKNTNWDTTIGWILGFRQLTEYPLGNKYIEYDANDDTATYYENTTSYYTYDSLSNIATIVGDTTVSVNLYNYFMIIINDFAQNRLNDGLVGISSQQTSITTNSYANRSNYTCDPVSGNKIFLGTYTNNNNNTQNEIYSENQKILSAQPQVKKYGYGTFVDDVFAIIPLNVGNLSTGSIYVETGSGLQKQERIYFGPVNLSRMNIKLITDRGDSVDLNGSDWSCTLQCDQFYQNKNI